MYQEIEALPDKERKERKIVIVHQSRSKVKDQGTRTWTEGRERAFVAVIEGETSSMAVCVLVPTRGSERMSC